VEAKNKVELQATDPFCTPTTCAVTGKAQSPCAVYNDSPATMNIPTITSAATPDPLAANTLATLNAFCTNGTSVTTPLIGGVPLNTNFGPGCDQIQPGVWCSSTAISVSPQLNPSICPSQASFISADTVGITGDGAITITAAPGVPNQIIAFSNYSGPGIAIQL